MITQNAKEGVIALKKIPIFCLLFLFHSLLCSASAVNILDEQSSALGLGGLTAAAGEYAQGTAEGGVTLEDGLASILDTGGAALGGIAQRAVRSSVLLLVVVLLCGLAQQTQGLGTAQSTALEVIPMVGTLAVTAISVADVSALIGLGRGAMGSMDAFSKVLLPTMTAAAAASGAPIAAAARQLATMLFSSVLLTLITGLLLPMVYGYIAACAAYAAIANEGLRRIAGLIKSTATWILTATVALFVGYLTVSGAIAGTADAAAIKAAKFAVSTAVPVVGGILSDAAEAVLAGAGILKNAVGVFGMLAILSMCLVPFLSLALHYLAYKLTSALSATVSQGRVSGLIGDLAGAFGLVLGMTGASAFLLLCAMVSAVAMVPT